FSSLGACYDGPSNTTRMTLTVRFECLGVSYIAIGTDDFPRISPTDGSTYVGNLGTYRVVWTNSNGNPGFTSIKFQPNFTGVPADAVEFFVIVVAGDASNAQIQVQGHQGPVTDTFTLTALPSCQPTPTSTPTNTPTRTPTVTNTPTITSTSTSTPTR